MEVSIIIVNWNSSSYVRKCLNAIWRNVTGLDIEVIVVDNASYDGCREIVAAEFPQTTFIQSQVNLGFARANNLGAARAQGSVLLFLNPDTEVLGNALVQMYSVFVSRNDAGAVGCKLLNTDGTLQTSCIQPFPTILNQVLNAEILLRLASKVGAWGTEPLFSAAKGVFPVEVISGACLMTRKVAFLGVGGFTSDYFMYTEDIDLCHKLRCAGFVNYFVNSATVVHHGGGSSNTRTENSFANIQMQESVFKYFVITKGVTYARGYRLAIFIVALARIGLMAAISIPSVCLGRITAIRSSFVKWVGILRWSLAMEKWAK